MDDYTITYKAKQRGGALAELRTHAHTHVHLSIHIRTMKVSTLVTNSLRTFGYTCLCDVSE